MGEKPLENSLELRMDEDFLKGDLGLANTVLLALFPRLGALALAIVTFEGWYSSKSARCRRNNNPGNLRSSRLQTRAEDGFSYFATPARGFFALLFDLLSKCVGRTVTKLDPFSSKVKDLIEVYAPWSENQTDHYVQFVGKFIDVELRLLQLLYPDFKPFREENVES